MPVYNAEKYLIEALRSISASSFTNFNVIVVENGSTDKSLELLNNYARVDKRFAVFSLKNKGLVEAMNFGIKQSKTKYVAIMDSDDLCNKYRFEKQIQYLEHHKEIILVGTSVYYFIDNKRKWGIKLPTKHNDILSGINKHVQTIFNPTIMFRNIKPQILYKENDYPVPDIGFFIRMSKIGKLANIHNYRHGARLSEKSFTAKNFENIVLHELTKYGSKNKSFIYKIYFFINSKRIIVSKIYYRRAIISYLAFNHYLFVVFSVIAFSLQPINSMIYIKNKLI